MLPAGRQPQRDASSIQAASLHDAYSCSQSPLNAAFSVIKHKWFWT